MSTPCINLFNKGPQLYPSPEEQGEKKKEITRPFSRGCTLITDLEVTSHTRLSVKKWLREACAAGMVFDPCSFEKKEWAALESKIFGERAGGMRLDEVMRWLFHLIDIADLGASSLFLEGQSLIQWILLVCPSYFLRMVGLPHETTLDLEIESDPTREFTLQMDAEEISQLPKLLLNLAPFFDKLGFQQVQREGPPAFVSTKLKTTFSIAFGTRRSFFTFEESYLSLCQSIKRWNGELPVPYSCHNGLVHGALRFLEPVSLNVELSSAGSEQCSSEEEHPASLNVIKRPKFKSLINISRGSKLQQAQKYIEYLTQGFIPDETLFSFDSVTIKEHLNTWVANWKQKSPEFALSCLLNLVWHAPLDDLQCIRDLFVGVVKESKVSHFLKAVSNYLSSKESDFLALNSIVKLCVFIASLRSGTKLRAQFVNGKEVWLSYKRKGGTNLCFPSPSIEEIKNLSVNKGFSKKQRLLLRELIGTFFALNRFDGCSEKSVNILIDLSIVGHWVILLQKSPEPICKFLSLHLLRLTDATVMKKQSHFLLNLNTFEVLFDRKISKLGSLTKISKNIIGIKNKETVSSHPPQILFQLFEKERHQLAQSFLNLLLIELRLNQQVPDWVELVSFYVKEHRKNPAMSLDFLIDEVICLFPTLKQQGTVAFSKQILQVFAYLIERASSKNKEELLYLINENLIAINKKDKKNRVEILALTYQVCVEKLCFFDAKQALRKLFRYTDFSFQEKELYIRTLFFKSFAEKSEADLDIFDQWVDTVSKMGDVILSDAQCTLLLKASSKVHPIQDKVRKENLKPLFRKVWKHVDSKDVLPIHFSLLWNQYILGLPFDNDQAFQNFLVNVLFKACSDSKIPAANIEHIYVFGASSTSNQTLSSRHKSLLLFLVEKASTENRFSENAFGFLMTLFEKTKDDSEVLSCAKDVQKRLISEKKGVYSIKVLNQIIEYKPTNVLVVDEQGAFLMQLFSFVLPSEKKDFLKELIKINWLQLLSDEAFSGVCIKMKEFVNSMQGIRPDDAKEFILARAHWMSEWPSLYPRVDEWINVLNILCDRKYLNQLFLTFISFLHSNQKVEVVHFQKLFVKISLCFSSVNDMRFIPLLDHIKVEWPRDSTEDQIKELVDGWKSLIESALSASNTASRSEKEKVLLHACGLVNQLQKRNDEEIVNTYLPEEDEDMLKKLDAEDKLLFLPSSKKLMPNMGFQECMFKGALFALDNRSPAYDTIDLLVVTVLEKFLSLSGENASKLIVVLSRCFVNCMHSRQVIIKSIPVMLSMFSLFNKDKIFFEKKSDKKSFSEIIERFLSLAFYLEQKKFPLQQVLDELICKSTFFSHVLFGASLLYAADQQKVLTHKPNKWLYRILKILGNKYQPSLKYVTDITIDMLSRFYKLEDSNDYSCQRAYFSAIFFRFKSLLTGVYGLVSHRRISDVVPILHCITPISHQAFFSHPEFPSFFSLLFKTLLKFASLEPGSFSILHTSLPAYIVGVKKSNCSKTCECVAEQVISLILEAFDSESKDEFRQRNLLICGAFIIYLCGKGIGVQTRNQCIGKLAKKARIINYKEFASLQKEVLDLDQEHTLLHDHLCAYTDIAELYGQLHDQKNVGLNVLMPIINNFSKVIKNFNNYPGLCMSEFLFFSAQISQFTCPTIKGVLFDVLLHKGFALYENREREFNYNERKRLGFILGYILGALNLEDMKNKSIFDKFVFWFEKIIRSQLFDGFPKFIFINYMRVLAYSNSEHKENKIRDLLNVYHPKVDLEINVDESLFTIAQNKICDPASLKKLALLYFAVSEEGEGNITDFLFKAT